jgi:hypothetical protein
MQLNILQTVHLLLEVQVLWIQSSFTSLEQKIHMLEVHTVFCFALLFNAVIRWIEYCIREILHKFFVSMAN